MISSYTFYFFVGLLTMYAVSVGYAMVRMYQFMRWMAREQSQHMFSPPDEVRYWDGEDK